jgi:outer membrane receptor for Fe3+-dicitrate
MLADVVVCVAARRGWAMPRFFHRSVAAAAILAYAASLCGGALAQPSAKSSARRAHDGARAAAPDDQSTLYVTGPGGEKRRALDVPGGATVITRKQMDDMQAITIGEALRFAPGVIVRGR